MEEKLEQTAGWISEADAAAKIGVSREALRKLREAGLAEGTDWRKSGQRIELSAEAYAFAKKEMGADGLSEKEGAQGGAEELDELDTLDALEAEDSERMDTQDMGAKAMVVYSVPRRNVRVLVCTRVPESWRELVIAAGLVGLLADRSFESLPDETRAKAWLMFAEKNERGVGVTVRVRNNANFMPGMEIMAKPDSAYSDLFVLEGRCPRYRGRW